MKNQKLNIKRIRRLIALIVFFLIIAIILFFVFRKKDYEITYIVNDYEIKESYFKEKDYYTFTLSKEDISYITVINHQHFSSNKIIYDIETIELESEECIKIQSSKARFTPLCRKDNNQVSVHLVSEEMKSKLEFEENEYSDDVVDSYNNVTVHNYLNANYFVWNYRGFYFMNDSKKEEISLFSKDIYSPTLITQVDNLLFIPDYDADYYFNKVYILNMSNGRIDTWNLSESIYFDSSILGVYEKDLYLVDKHEKKEWKLNLEKKTMEVVGTENRGGTIYLNGWEDINMNRLLYQDNSFEGVSISDFVIQDNSLYSVINNFYIKIKDGVPKKIVGYHNGFVYYFVDSFLYAFSEDTGEVLLLDYFEWNFNYDNVVFVLN